MTQDEIIRMAREAGCYEKYKVCYFVQEDLERFAALVAAHEREKLKNVAIFSKWYEELDKAVLAEREACAKVCDAYAEKCVEAENWEAEDVSLHCAAAIRARGE